VASEADLVIRLFLAAVLGGAIGLERELRDQPAGFRTHILVAVGSCLFALVSAFGFDAFLELSPEEIRFDPSRVAAQIVTGIGFLGAGAIIRYGMTVRGLTTAASLWVVAAIGLAVAVGEFTAAGVATGITVLSLWLLRRVRPRIARGLKPGHEEYLLEADRHMDLAEVIRRLVDARMRIDHLRVEEEDDIRQIVLVLTIPPGKRAEEVVGIIDAVPGIRNVDWTR
jgi:putative Mg2+ transporter-C (MgtC) family protein